MHRKVFPEKFPENWDVFTFKYNVTGQESTFLCL